MKQATITELKDALNDLAQCIGIVGAESEARYKLSVLRYSKTTWIGKEENDLRFVIDNALRS